MPGFPRDRGWAGNPGSTETGRPGKAKRRLELGAVQTGASGLSVIFGVIRFLKLSGNSGAEADSSFIRVNIVEKRQ
jgi:hypothetical protein